MQSTNFQTIECKLKDSTAYITLNRPELLNAFNAIMFKELDFCLKEIRLKDQIKFVVLDGKGEAFSAGGDLQQMQEIKDEDTFLRIMDDIHSMTMAFFSMPQLTIAAVEGPVAGFGLSLVLGADYIICDENSKLAMNFINVGLVPDGGGHFLLKERIGSKRAMQMIWEGNTLKAEEALKIGLIDSITSDVFQSVSEQLDKWRKKPILAMIKTKKILAELNREQLLKTLELEKHAQWAMRQTSDHQEGITAFFEKRAPRFQGK